MNNNKLYPKQKELSDKLIKQFEKDNEFNCLFLSGEMGVGKTHMSSYIIDYFNNKYKYGYIILLAPNNVYRKFKALLGDILVKPSSTDNLNEDNKVYFFTHRSFSAFLNKADNETKKNISEKLNFLVIDESQELSYNNIQMINDLKNSCKKDLKLLCLTGTIFDGTLSKLENLLNTFYEKYSYKYNIKDLFSFINVLWKYISVSLSLDDLKEHTNLEDNNDIQQKIMPIDFVEIDNEEKLFYDLVKNQLGNFYSTEYKDDNISKNELMASAYLDFPDKDFYFKKNNKVEDDTNLKISTYNIVSLPLTKKITIEDTNKYKRAKDILNDNKGQKTLIYINDDDFGKHLNKTLQKDGYLSEFVNKNDNLDIRINKIFETKDIVIINPRLIKIGIDIQAENIIWYQLLTNVTDILQAQRRITRLNSTTESKIYFLGYDNTAQKRMLNYISNIAKNNAAAYGFKDKSNLSKLTGILLDF